MDPASAVGTASAAITLFEFTYSFLKTAYELYDHGSSAGYARLESVAKDMGAVSSKLIDESPPPPSATEDEVALVNLAKQCHQLSTDLVRQIGARKADEKRIQFAIKGAFKLVCARDVIVRLQNDLERCQAQFHLRLTVLRSEQIQGSLEKLQQASDDFRKELVKGRERANQRNIIQSLKFDVMDERYQDIPRAAEKTFEWIMKNQDAQTSSNRKLRFGFRDWLLTGDDVFHISGKPGSGKSTLMKFLCNHPETEDVLKTWAGARKLLTARFFFWKSGSSFQKTLRGLMRSLLCLILEQCLEVIPQVLPDHWDPSEYEFWNSHPFIEITHDEIATAFEILIETTSVHKDYASCFFIDGLDEFEDPSLTHGDLISSILGWVNASHGALKICVSSREWPAFLNRLPDSHRLKLQDLTRNDIETVVWRELGKEEHFQELTATYPIECRKLERRIVDNAQGVFLWVTLTLRVLRQGLENLETLQDLNIKLKDIPLELEAFYSYILDSILWADRRKALFALAFTVAASEDNGVSNESLHPGFTLFRTSSLFRYAFLSPYTERKDFAEDLEFSDLSREQIQERMKVAETQIYGYCKGLLEVRDEHGDSGCGVFSTKPSKKVIITHTSILQFLKAYLNSHQQELRGFDYAEACIQTLIAVVKSIVFNTTHCFDQGMFHLLENLVALIRDHPAQDKTPYFHQLDLLDDAIGCRQAAILPDLKHIRWLKFSIMSTITGFNRPLFSTILHASVYECFCEYVRWKIEKSPELLSDDLGVILLEAVVDGIFYYQRDLSELLRELLGRRGLSPNSVSPTPDYGGLTIWELHATRLLLGAVRLTRSWKAAQTFLEHGAPAPVWVLPMPESTGVPLVLKFGRTYVVPEDISLGWGERLWHKRIDLGGGRKTLFSIMEKLNPDNAEDISRLLESADSCSGGQSLLPANTPSGDTERPLRSLCQTIDEPDLNNHPQWVNGDLGSRKAPNENIAQLATMPALADGHRKQQKVGTSALNLAIKALVNPATAWMVTLCVLLFTMFSREEQSV